MTPMHNRTSPRPETKALTSIVARLSKEIIALSYRRCEEIILGGEDGQADALALLFAGHLAGLAISKADLVKAAAFLFSDDEEGFCDLFEAVARRIGDDLDPLG